MNTDHVDSLAQVIWDYMKLDMPLEKADLLIGFGSHDKRTATRTAELYLEGYAPQIIFSGHEGWGKKVSGFDGVPEAKIYFDEATKLGVPKTSITVENKSKNSSENVLFTAQLIQRQKLKSDKIIVVHKPYMERRTLATLTAQWPGKQPQFILTSPQLSYKEYFNDPLYPRQYMIDVMVGDLQRIKEYPKYGYQIEQPIPNNVWQAYEELVKLGFNKHVINSQNT